MAVRERRRRVIVLGLDGATWRLLKPWMAEGRLPHLARALREGVHGELESTIPPYSAPAWVSFATGKNPGKHGVVDWWRFPPLGNSDKTPVSSRSIVGSPLWEIISQSGKAVGVLNMPVSYPPSPVNGFMVSGISTPSEESGYTYPGQLKADLLARVPEYRAPPIGALLDLDLAKAVPRRVKVQEEAVRFLLERYQVDCFIEVQYAPDRLQHSFWHYLDPSHPAHPTEGAAPIIALLRECYQSVDEVVGQRLEMLGGQATLFIISDHGFGPAHRRFYVNRFLAELGLLALNDSASGPVSWIRSRLGGSPEDRGELRRRVDVLGLRKMINLDLRRRLVERLDKFLDRSLGTPIDWSRTRAYFGSSSNDAISINLRGRDKHGIVEPGEEYEALREFIIRELRGLRDPATGETVVKEVWRKEEVFSGGQLSSMPDIFFSLGSRPYVLGERLFAPGVFEDLLPETLTGRHHSQGIFVAVGPSIQKGASIQGSRIIDLAPTILYALGLPIPDDMDGRVLEEIFAPAYLRANPPRLSSTAPSPVEAAPEDVYSAEEAKRIEEHLRSLGYLD